MKLVFFGDSITDMRRDRDTDDNLFGLGFGHVRIIADRLLRKPNKYSIINRGIGGDKSVDLYARIERDVWQEKPDVLSILVGINDIWHMQWKNGVDMGRYEKVMRAILEETKAKLPNVKIVLCEPFVLHGNESDDFGFEDMNKIREYAKVCNHLSCEYKTIFLPLQDKLDEAAKIYGEQNILYDGVHPNTFGAGIIADLWLDIFEKEIMDKK